MAISVFASPKFTYNNILFSSFPVMIFADLRRNDDFIQMQELRFMVNKIQFLGE